ncbi:MAG: large conductance mechanosensitive channel protein MscL [Clostridia bacterium]|jgi:large conductance mechanosensitive channel|nr:large conductance mechanosensitive channel protein MscL [Clostridia bacterium]
MKKLFKEFKTFITRGNVIDLAVGMIIGAAFTAIVTALVNGIFKPLINAIPMGDLSGLITMLVPKNADGIQVAFGSADIDLSKSVYIDWGDFIMAIVNFLLTAVILFAIIKTINTFRDGGKKYKLDITEAERAELKAQGMNRKQMREHVAKKAAEEKARAEAEAAANAPETTEQILKDIRALLATLRPSDAKTDIERAVAAAEDKD